MILEKNKLGFIQGRLTKQKKKIQQFPIENWKKEFRNAKKLKLTLIEWTIDHYGFYKNPLLNRKYVKLIKNISKINNINDSVTAVSLWKTILEAKKSKLLFKKIELLIKFCGIYNLKFIILPLVDNSSIKTNSRKKLLLMKLKNLIIS